MCGESENRCIDRNFREKFPFADKCHLIKNQMQVTDLEVFAEILSLIQADTEKIIVVSNLPGSPRKKTDFIDNAMLNIRKIQMLPKKFWDLSRSSWVTDGFVNINDEKVFNARNIVYKKYGTNFRFIHDGAGEFCCNVNSVRKAIELVQKSKLTLPQVDSIIISYLEMLGN